MIRPEPDDLRAALDRLGAGRGPTPLLDCTALAETTGVARLFIKDESRRPLGNFKSLGGVYAGLRALARAGGVAGVAELFDRPAGPPLPALITASDGNHGLSVATAAELAGAPARIYLPASVPLQRRRRIAARGADIIVVDGSYDDAVDQAAAAAARGEGLLVADTSERLDDPAVNDVMAGYTLMAREIADQCAALDAAPSHMFVQSGVGGLAAAMADGLSSCMARPPRIVSVEPEAAACVARAMATGRPERVSSDLRTSADMLACGIASAPAVAALLRHGALAMTVSEAQLAAAVNAMRDSGGPHSTPSGACGLAGLIAAADDTALRNRLCLDPASIVIVIASEGPVA